MKRFLGVLATLGGLALVAWIGWWSIRALSRPEAAADAGPVQTAKAVRRDIVQTIELSGEVKPALMTPIKSEISGRILRLAVVDGQAVKAGTPLLDLKPYVPKFDSVPGSRAGWFDAAGGAGVADGRFERPKG